MLRLLLHQEHTMNLNLIPYYLQNPPPSIDDSWDDMDVTEAQDLMRKVAVFNDGTTLEPCDSVRWSSATRVVESDKFKKASLCRRLFRATTTKIAVAGRAAYRTMCRAAKILKRSHRAGSLETPKHPCQAYSTPPAEYDCSDWTAEPLRSILELNVRRAVFT